uniref:7TM_GPCR_Srx domain-containing protein n=1 Tax=Meloidogyne hapla TaxID=6305 RepID=A0A1I8BQG5_MELHA
MNQTLCIDAEISVLDTSYNIIRGFHLLFGTIVLILIVRIIWSYRTKSLQLHTNLIFVYFTYKNSCDCLIEVWVVYLIRIPFYLYVAGSPLFHFAIMLERVFATIFVRIYENRGKMIGIIITTIVVNLLGKY